MNFRIAFASLLIGLTACQSESLTTPSADQSASNTTQTGTAGGSAGVARVRCEVRSNRSKISVDGKNLAPLGGTFSAKVTSGANTASSPAQTALGDEAEFDFDSDPGDIAAGAVAIAPTFISGGSVTGQIVNSAGTVVASGTASCRSR